MAKRFHDFVKRGRERVGKYFSPHAEFEAKMKLAQDFKSRLRKVVFDNFESFKHKHTYMLKLSSRAEMEISGGPKKDVWQRVVRGILLGEVSWMNPKMRNVSAIYAEVKIAGIKYDEASFMEFGLDKHDLDAIEQVIKLYK